MADKTDEQFTAEIHQAVIVLNKLMRDAQLAGLKTDINTQSSQRIGMAPFVFVTAEVSRVYTPPTPTEAVSDQENGNG